MLLDSNGDMNASNQRGLNPLHLAAENGVSSRQNPTTRCVPLFSWVTLGFHEVVEILIRAEADVDASNGRGITPLHMTDKNGQSPPLRGQRASYNNRDAS